MDETRLEELVRWMMLRGATDQNIREVLFVLRSTEGPWYIRMSHGIVEIQWQRSDACDTLH